MTKVTDLTLEEQASLTSGADMWHTKPVERAGVPAIMVSDGPHGLRKQVDEGDPLGIGGSVPATCFPPAVSIGCSFDPDLFARVGAALGAEASIQNVAVLLGPAINIKRSPLCGRNFEYISEDPIVSGVLGAAYVTGVQSQGVGTSLKHFAANNQEFERMSISAEIDERTLHEIYLRAFERVVTESKPWTVMCSYNKINGVLSSQNEWLLTEPLRKQWGYEGLVVSDWGAVNNSVAAVAAGLDLQMPGTQGKSDAEIVKAVKAGKLAEQAVASAAQHVLDLVATATKQAGKVTGPLDVDAHNQLAREAATRSIVLLRNEGGILPLKPNQKIAVIGAFAKDPRYQGAGSSKVNPTELDNALAAIQAISGDVPFAEGFSLKPGASDADNAKLQTEAVQLAKDAETVVLFLGLPAELESEGYDRATIDLPAEQLALLDAVVEANPNVVVVLSNGGVVAVPFAETVPGIIEGWLLGQAGGGATADVLFGIVNPSGKLTETIPLRMQDTPAYLNFPGEFDTVNYGEGLFVGYRWYDARELDVAFPFGFGLSYTSFEYGDASAHVTSDGDVEVSFSVKNTGTVDGREIVQVYTGLELSRVQRPVRELKGFASVALAPGQAKVVTITIRREDLAYWNIAVSQWVIEGGRYTVSVGASSRDIRSTTTVDIVGDVVRIPLTRDSLMSTVMENPVAGPIVQEKLQQAMSAASGLSEIMPEGVSPLQLIGSIPIGRLGQIVPIATDHEVDELIAAANQHL